MNHPHGGAIPSPGDAGQIKTLIVTEGIPVAVLMTATTSENFAEQPMPMPTPEAALAWCRANRSRMVYLPALPDPKRN